MTREEFEVWTRLFVSALSGSATTHTIAEDHASGAVEIANYALEEWRKLRNEIEAKDSEEVKAKEVESCNHPRSLRLALNEAEWEVAGSDYYARSLPGVGVDTLMFHSGWWGLHLHEGTHFNIDPDDKIWPEGVGNPPTGFLKS